MSITADIHDEITTHLRVHPSEHDVTGVAFATLQICDVDESDGREGDELRVSLYFRSGEDVLGWMTAQLDKHCRQLGVPFPDAPIDFDGLAEEGRAAAAESTLVFA